MTRPSRTGGKTSEAKARNTNPAKSRKTTKTKRGIAPAATRVKRRSVSGLSKDLKEAREQQAATVEILKAIASSPSDTTPVFEAIASSAKRLLGGYSAAVFRYIDDNVHLAAFTPTKPAADEALKADFPTPVEQFVAFRLAQHGKPFPISDTEEVSHAPVTAIARLHGFRSMLWVPMVNADVTIGVICVTRVEPGAFAPPHTQLLQTFANQAVIAIENTRLFNETREALERQTATAEILKVIASSPSDVQPVFDAIAASANRLLGGFSSTVFRFIDGMAHLKAFTPTTPEADEILQSTFPRPVGNFAPFRMTQAGEVMQIPDTEAPTYGLKEIARARGYRGMLYAPLMNKGVSIGFIAVTRVQPGTFADHQVQLLRTFADQAVIAIENARLFDEVQAKTRDLSESLQQQTATSDVLKVIASSPTDVEPALQAIVESACALCDAYDANVLLKIGDDLEFSAHHGPIPTGQYPRPINRQWVTGRSVVDRVPVQVSDFQAPEAAEFPEGQRQSREQGHRCTLSVPLLREGEAIGAIVLRRLEPVAFNEKQTALLQTFADQAVIAIENARLFNETKEALERQTATADILKVIASSPSDVQPVFDAIAERSKRLVDALSTTVFRLVDGMMHLTAFTSTSPEADATLRAIFPAPLLTFSWGESILRGEIYRVTDSEHEPEGLRDLARRRGWRSCLCVPLLRDGKPIGMIGPTRAEPGPFADHHVQLLQTFADQAVIAISNVQLFQQVQERTSELSASLDDLRATQDRLVQTEKLASLGQLTAGIAHEIKNPLNFVNNFSALSAELTDELKEVLMQERLHRQGPGGTGRTDAPLEGQSRQGCSARQAGQFHRQEHAAALARGLRRAPIRRHQRASRGESQPGLSRRPGGESQLQYSAEARPRSRGGRGRPVPAGDHPSTAKPDFQRLLCRDQAQGRNR